MTNNKNNNNKDRDIIYSSETGRENTHIEHQADGDTYKNGRKINDGDQREKVVVEEHDHVHHDHIEREPKKKGPWAWLIPLLLLLLAIPLIMNLCGDKKEDEKATTEEATTEEKVETTEEETTEEAAVKKFDLATITNFDLAS